MRVTLLGVERDPEAPGPRTARSEPIGFSLDLKEPSMSTTRQEDQPLSVTPRSQRIALARGAAALAALTFLAMPSLAQQAPVRQDALVPAATYRIYHSHVEWRNDGTANPAADPNRPAYHIRTSHIEWDADRRPTFPRVDCNDWCTSPVRAYDWNDVTQFFSGR